MEICESIISTIQSQTGNQYNIAWITVFDNEFGETLHSMSLVSAVRRSLNIILDRGESPERQLSPRSKIMSKLAATRNLCWIKKVQFFFHYGCESFCSGKCIEKSTERYQNPHVVATARTTETGQSQFVLVNNFVG